MNNYIFKNDLDNKNYKRIDRRQALKLYTAGKTIILCASNMRPFTMWHYETNINIKRHAEYITDEISKINLFNDLSNSYLHYNCINSETGRRVNYYVAID